MANLFFALLLCFFSACLSAQEAQDSAKDKLAQMLIQVRAEYGVHQGLLVDEAAEEVSAQYAQWLFTQQDLSHMDMNGRNAVKRYRLGGGSALSTGEILGRGPDLERIVQMWLKSPTHRQVLLDPRWTAFGVGLAEDGHTYVATVLFTTSISTQRAFSWNGNSLEVEVTLREGMLPEVWLQAGNIQAVPVSIENERILKFVLSTNGPEQCMIFNSSGQGDLLVIPARYD